MTAAAAAEVFARTVIAFEPYVADVVFVGGWVHALYLAARTEGGRPVMTDDVDVSLPAALDAADRPMLRDLAIDAGFFPNWLSMLDGQVEHLVYEIPNPRHPDRAQVVDLDLLTEASAPRTAVPIVGQRDLTAQGYPGQQLLQEQTMWIEVGPVVHPLLDPPRLIRVPTLGAYVLHKGVASTTRAIPAKAIKDLVYIYEIVKDPTLGPIAVEGIRALIPRYPAEYQAWETRLGAVWLDPVLQRAVAEQIVTAAGTFGAMDVVAARVASQFGRVLAETRLCEQRDRRD